MAKTFASFDTWAQLLDAIAAGYPIYYQAPLDVYPWPVTTVVRRDGQLRVTPTYKDAYPFTADVAHLGRFRRIIRNS